MSTNLSAVLIVFALLRTCQQALALEPHDVQDKQGVQVKRRLSLQSTGEQTRPTHARARARTHTIQAQLMAVHALIERLVDCTYAHIYQQKKKLYMESVMTSICKYLTFGKSGLIMQMVGFYEFRLRTIIYCHSIMFKIFKFQSCLLFLDTEMLFRPLQT